VKQGNTLPGWICKSVSLGLVWLLTSVCGWGQQSSPPVVPPPGESMAAAVQELQEQVRELHAAVVEIRAEAAQYRAETAQLRQELQATRSQLAVASTPPAQQEPPARTSETATTVEGRALTSGSVPSGSLAERVASLEEASQLMSSKVDDQYQTKVESASKYRVRLSGLALLNLFSNRGTTDNSDFPSWAIAPGPFDSKGDFGASLRQSELGLEVFGPRLAGAKTSGNLQVDFSGGFTSTANGNNLGLIRMRIATMRMDWEKTSLVVGQDNLFLSPLSPTSFASLAVPALAYAGNLWGWIPQVRAEHRFDLSGGQKIVVQGGILDNITGEPPYYAFSRTPQAGERSSQPAYGVRIAWTGNIVGQPMTLGAAGYYSRQDWVIDHHVDGWAGMADWDIPIAPRVSLSGEFYRGLAVGGFGGGIGRSVLYSDNGFGPTTRVRGLESIGGWSQLKVKATAKLEFNGAVGVDNPFAEYLREFSAGQNYLGPPLTQNRSGLVNFVYRPRSNLLFSTEYRHLKTYQLSSGAWSAEQVNLMMGILF
jgi:hypothetical protein